MSILFALNGSSVSFLAVWELRVTLVFPEMLLMVVGSVVWVLTLPPPQHSKSMPAKTKHQQKR